MNRLTVEKFREVSKNPIVLVLDNIRSMHNVGSIFRTADGFKVERIYLCGITATPPHREIRKTAIGAEKSVDWVFAESASDLITELKETHCIISLEQTDNSVSLSSYEPQSKPIALVFGNEVDGVSDNVIQKSDMVVEIPQFGTKHSFNVSVSAGISMWEIAKKEGWCE